MSRVLAIAGLLAMSCRTAPPGETAWRPLFDGYSLSGFAITSFGGEGGVRVEPGRIVLEPGSPLTGITWTGEVPHGDYELVCTAARLRGNDFFCGLTFPVGDGHLTLILGGWGGTVCGLSSLDGLDAAHNETRTLRRFEIGRPYTVQLEIRRDRVDVQLDGKPLLDCALAGRRPGLRPEVEPSLPLGVAAFATRAAIWDLRWRPLPP